MTDYNAARLAQYANDYNSQAFLQGLVATANTSGTAVSTCNLGQPVTYTVKTVGWDEKIVNRRADSSNVAWLNRRVDELRVRL